MYIELVLRLPFNFATRTNQGGVDSDLCTGIVYREKKRTWNPIFKELKVQIKARAYLYKRWTLIHKALHRWVKRIE